MGLSTALGAAVGFLVDWRLLPLADIFIEPAKVLFLNNAINHGILGPLGVADVQKSGKAIHFLLETNPGPGLGLLLAYWVAGKGSLKQSAPGAMIIHFLGGIHEIYFPYVLAKPVMIVAMCAGGMTQVFINVSFDSGLRAPAAPGSVIAVYAQTPERQHRRGHPLDHRRCGGIVRRRRRSCSRPTRPSRPRTSWSRATARHGGDEGQVVDRVGRCSVGGATASSGPIRNIVFACDAGMGSSAMGASVLRRKVHGAGFTDVTVVNKAIANLTDDFDLVVSHQDLTERAALRSTSAVHVSVENFMDSPAYDEIVELVRQRNGACRGCCAPRRMSRTWVGTLPVGRRDRPRRRG